jgi:quercetin dioxygenase-like cupin family protein
MIKEEKVERVIGLIAYQDGSVVSKTLIKESAGSVTLFALDKDQGLHEHSAPYDAMVYILEGIAEITIAGDAREVKQGEMLIMPANIPHALKAVEQFKMMLVMIKS